MLCGHGGDLEQPPQRRTHWVRRFGLVVVDEAHYNSFRKLFKHFDQQVLLGVTTTPVGNIKLPLHDNYIELIVGESIGGLVEQGFLAKANTYCYGVNLRALKVGINGDYTVSSSERLYGNFLMQEKLLYAYEEKAKGTKTLIFNNGINTSKQVQAMFAEEGYPCMHLDNTHSEKSASTSSSGFTPPLMPCCRLCPS